MKGSATINHSYSIIVKQDDLRSLNSFICSEFKYVEYKIFTKNGAGYDIDGFDEIIGYDNYDFKKIIRICIKAKNEKPISTIIYPDLEISMSDIDEYPTSISYCINNATDKEIDYRMQKVEELIHGFRTKYFWLFKTVTECIVVLIFALCIIIPLLILLNNKIDKILYYLLPSSMGTLFGTIGAVFYDKFVSFFFPRTIFCIGRQQEVFEKKKRRRQNWLLGIIVAFPVSLFASLLAYFLTK